MCIVHPKKKSLGSLSDESAMVPKKNIRTPGLDRSKVLDSQIYEFSIENDMALDWIWFKFILNENLYFKTIDRNKINCLFVEAANLG